MWQNFLFLLLVIITLWQEHSKQKDSYHQTPIFLKCYQRNPFTSSPHSTLSFSKLANGEMQLPHAWLVVFILSQWDIKLLNSPFTLRTSHLGVYEAVMRQSSLTTPSIHPAVLNTLNKSPVHLWWQDKYHLPPCLTEKPVHPRGVSIHFPKGGNKDKWWFVNQHNLLKIGGSFWEISFGLHKGIFLSSDEGQLSLQVFMIAADKALLSWEFVGGLFNIYLQ